MSQSEVKVFIGSSTESLKIAEIIKNCLNSSTTKLHNNNRISASIWNDFEDLRTGEANRTVMQHFQTILDTYDFGLFILSNDDTIHSRGEIKETARDNVWLEAGMFIGRKGLTNVFLFTSESNYKDSKIKIPSDLFGVVLNSVNWEPSIVNLYLTKNRIIEKDNEENIAIKRKIEVRIREEISGYCQKVIKWIDTRLKEQSESESVVILRGNELCFDKGIELVKSAKKRLYTSVSFAKSFDPKITSNENRMEEMLISVIKENKLTSFQRFMDMGNEKIEKQKKRLQEYVNSTFNVCFPNIAMNYFEFIISDDNVLLVFPDFTSSDKLFHEQVGFGILIKENKNLAKMLSSLFIHKSKKLEEKSNGK